MIEQHSFCKHCGGAIFKVGSFGPWSVTTTGNTRCPTHLNGKQDHEPKD
jgi:hypothetical protein